MIDQRTFSTEGVHPFDQIEWELRDVEITDDKGNVIFEQKDIEAPKSWSVLSTRIVCSKYFYGKIGTPERETSIKQLISRVADTITMMGDRDGYFKSDKEAKIFNEELTWLLINQHGAFNSPVWFNVGLWHKYEAGKHTQGNYVFDRNDTLSASRAPTQYEYPQCSACFIQSVDDNMESIMALATSEAMLFKFGSGTGSDLSTIRSSREGLSGGGKPSGPLSFLKVYDQVANVVKSGGKCLAPDQLVYTEKGPKTAKELADKGDDFITLSYDPPAGRVKAKWARAWKSGQKPLVCVKTDKGEFKVSYDHPFRLADGSVVRAYGLKNWMRLHAVSLKEHSSGKGYVHVALNRGRHADRELLHRLIAQDICGCEIDGKVIHHIDNDPTNNSPTNLQLMESQSPHASHHANELVAKGEHPFQLQTFDHAGSANGMHKSSAFYEDEEKVQAWKQRLGTQSKRYAKKAQLASAKQKIINSGYKLLCDGHDISTPDLYNKAMNQVFSYGRSSKQRNDSIEKFFGSHEEFVAELAENNHRVVSVENLGISDVYSIEVDCPTPDDKSPESGHNYAICSHDNLLSPVFVNNTRRAAKMNTLYDWHGDVEEFIDAKRLEEQKAHALIDAGYDGSFNGEAYGTVAFQNENLSIRVTDEFMKAATATEEKDQKWWTKSLTTGEKLEEKNASKLLDKIAHGTWFCGDPGLQYDSAIQNWHTCAGTEPVRSTNPCCFVGETLVDTSEGFISMEKLERAHADGMSLPHAFSWDTVNKTTVMRPILKAWVAGETDNLIEVTTDKGVVVKCTPEHRFLTHAGEWVQAKDLEAGTRLRKINRRLHPYGRWQVQSKKSNNGMLDQNRFMWMEANGAIPEGYDVHHKDEDKTNDKLSNFELVETLEHKSMHSEGANNPRFIDTDLALLNVVYDHIVATARMRSDSRSVVSAARWNKAVRELGLDGSVPKVQSRPDLGRGCYKIQGMMLEDFVSQLEEKRYAENDVVVSTQVIKLDAPVKVYDIEVEDSHNFGVRHEGYGHSLVVHNSEYIFLNNTACNLASINLLKFVKDGEFDCDNFKAAVRIFITAQEIVVDNSSYPTEAIAVNSHIFRTLGLGYANLGALIMSQGVPYDSDEARSLTGYITALMTGEAYAQSARIAKLMGPFRGFNDAHAFGVEQPESNSNKDSMLEVIEKHHKAIFSKRPDIEVSKFVNIGEAAMKSWDNALDLGRLHGYRNAQVTVIAPTGTIAFLMDCDTTGIEPELGLVKYKLLAGGGNLKIVNQSVRPALKKLGYDDNTIKQIISHIDKHDTIEDVDVNDDDKHVDTTISSGLKPEHLPVFDCAFTPRLGSRSIDWQAHLKIMSAAQPFISGAISKTINMPKDSTIKDIRQAYIDAWTMGLKCVAIYRDGSKKSQPLNTGKADSDLSSEEKLVKDEAIRMLTDKYKETARLLKECYGKTQQPIRKRLPDTRPGVNHKFSVGGHEGYIQVGLFDDNTIGEIFITMSKDGSTVAGLVNVIGALFSIAVQYGVPIDQLINKFRFVKFEPSGMTSNPNIRTAHSIIDYIVRWLDTEVLGNRGEKKVSEPVPEMPDVIKQAAGFTQTMSQDAEQAEKTAKKKSVYRDGETCSVCGSSNVTRTGSCATCNNCGTSLGCS